VNPELHGPLFLAAFAALQGLFGFWAYRTSGSVPTALLVALVPPVGLLYQLWQLRPRLHDNHVAGAVTYLALTAASFGFYLLTPADETPWMLIHTMSIFAFLGTANVIGTALKD
jgi:predicted membrane-bound mannosyltransferase